MPYSSGTFSRVHDFTDDRDNGIRIQASRMDAEMDGIATGLSTALLKDGTQTATATIPFAAGISIIDNQKITLGTNSDITLQYDETTNDSLEIAANVEGAALGIVLKSDQGDDNADQHKLSIADGGTLTLGSKISGSFVTYLTHTPNATVADSTLAVAGNLTVGGNLTLGSGAVLSEAELEQLDGITAGTVTASKAVVVDANKDIASFRNITLTGELDAGSLDISGDADIDGTLEADAMTLNGSAITTTATLSTGISNGNVLVATSGIADDDFLRVDGTSIEGRSASEVLSDIGGQASLTFGISNTNAVKIDSASVADDEFARFTANGLESRSAAEVLSDIGASPVAGSSSIVTTGALDSGSITSGFGNIDVGSSTITTTGALSCGAFTSNGIDDNADATAITITVEEEVGIGTSSVESLLHLSKSSATAYDATASDSQVGIGPTIYLENPANSNTSVGGQIVFGMRSTEAQARIGATGGTSPSLVFGTNDAQRMVIASDGKVGIGTNAPHDLFSVKGTSGATTDINFSGGDDTNEVRLFFGGNSSPFNGQIIYEPNNNAFKFATSGLERMRIDSSGHLMLNTTSARTGTNSITLEGGNSFLMFRATGTGSLQQASFMRSTDATASQVGSIFTSSVGTSFNQTSDYRLKENVNYSFDATTRLKKLKPARFNFIIDADTTVDGFLAHEVSSIVPEAITGEKDAVDADGNIDPQGIDQSKLVPLLVKTIQELEARITALEGA